MSETIPYFNYEVFNENDELNEIKIQALIKLLRPFPRETQAQLLEMLVKDE